VVVATVGEVLQRLLVLTAWVAAAVALLVSRVRLALAAKVATESLS